MNKPSRSAKKSAIRRHSLKKVKSKLNMQYDNIDVKTIEDVDKLIEHIKSNVVTLLLIYADWCGHCGTFKDGIWKKIATMKGRKMAIAQINEKVLANTPFAKTKIDGYPTNILVGRDMKPATFKDENGDSTNAMQNTRDLPTMTTLVTADPSQVVAANSMVKPLDEPKSAIPNTAVENKMDEEGTKVMNNLKSGKQIKDSKASFSVPNPPNVEDDILSTQVTTPSKNKGYIKNNATIGGSLYESLVEAARSAPSKSRRVKPRKKSTAKMMKRRS